MFMCVCVCVCVCVMGMYPCCCLLFAPKLFPHTLDSTRLDWHCIAQDAIHVHTCIPSCASASDSVVDDADDAQSTLIR